MNRAYFTAAVSFKPLNEWLRDLFIKVNASTLQTTTIKNLLWGKHFRSSRLPIYLSTYLSIMLPMHERAKTDVKAASPQTTIIEAAYLLLQFSRFCIYPKLTLKIPSWNLCFLHFLGFANYVDLKNISKEWPAFDWTWVRLSLVQCTSSYSPCCHLKWCLKFP